MVKCYREIINRWACKVFFSLSKTIPLEGCHLMLSGKEINQSEIFESEYNECTWKYSKWMLYSDDSSNSRKLQSMVKCYREIINRLACEVFFSLSKTIPLEGCHFRLSGKEINQSEIFEFEYNKCLNRNWSDNKCVKWLDNKCVTFIFILKS